MLFRSTLATLATLLLLVGCSSNPNRTPEGAPSITLLQDVDGMLRTAEATLKRLPAKVSDLDRQQAAYSRGYEAVKSGNVIVVWNVPFKGEGDAGKNEAIVAYEKNVPTEGGYVLMSAGTIKKMSASEFKSTAPKGDKS